MDVKGVYVDGIRVGTVVSGLDDEVSLGADGSLEMASLEDGSDSLSEPSWRGGGHAPGRGVPHHDDVSNAAPHRRTLGGPHRHSDVGRHLDSANKERESDSSKPQHFSVGDVKQAIAPTGINRESFRQELRDKPWLREKILHIAAGENEGREANQAVIESAMNRAAMMGTTLEQEMRRTSEGGYYAGYRANVAEPQRRMIEENIDKALAGSNVSNYATDNSSQGFHTSGSDPMYRTVKSSNGENFSVPNRSDARGHDRYEAWRASADAGGVGGKPVGVTALPPQKGESTFANIGGGYGGRAVAAPNGQAPAAFVVHHTGGRGDPASVVNDWRTNRPGVGTQYIMDREGNVHDVAKEFGYSGRSHFLHSTIPGVSNKSAVGMEIVANDDRDITSTQRVNAIRFIQENYPATPVYGHSEVSPSDRTDEGVAIANTVRQLRGQQVNK
jgi:hypothetical protein